MPMLWEVHEDGFRAIQCIVTYDTGFQSHGVVRESIINLDSKMIILEKHKYAHLDIVIESDLVSPDQRPGENTIGKNRSTEG